LVVLGFEFRALYLLFRCSTTWATSPALLNFSYFSDRVWSFLPRDHLGSWSFYLCFLCNWDYRHVPLCPAHLLRWVFLNFALAVHKLQFSQSPAPSNWDYSSEPLNLTYIVLWSKNFSILMFKSSNFSFIAYDFNVISEESLLRTWKIVSSNSFSCYLLGFGPFWAHGEAGARHDSLHVDIYFLQHHFAPPIIINWIIWVWLFPNWNVR
jgi:hypothetical protein